uniref:Condensin complex subunit 3 putative n=1 Tax=Albugo laibachii Nc14 TaxID=890382 RepID=F0W2X7_9STRA|nr:condensin complex subunit 3 putative [Albugo laibachii Nc14]|eukprot:CCA15414.1 condensin complex subunit 3 putative [Albugo laibachii Nc14]
MAIDMANVDQNTTKSKRQMAIKSAVAAAFTELQSYVMKNEFFQNMDEQNSLEKNLRVYYDMLTHYVSGPVHNKLSQRLESIKTKDATKYTCDLTNYLWKATERVILSIYLFKNPNVSAYDILIQTNEADKSTSEPDVATKWIFLLACFFGHVLNESASVCAQNGIDFGKISSFFAVLDKVAIAASSTENKQLRVLCMDLLRLTLIRVKLNSVPMKYELDENLTIHIIERCRDKVAMVRSHSVTALGYLQGISKMQDDIRDEMIRLANTDPSRHVRMTALDALVMTKDVFELVRNRLRDTDEEVRQTMYQSLCSTTFLITDLPLKERLFILDQGLQDHNTRVIEACENVILKKWLPDCDSDTIKVLRALDIELRPKTAEKVAQLLVRNDANEQRIKQSKGTNPGISSPGIIFLESLRTGNTSAITVEHAYYWRHECEHYSSEMIVNDDGTNECNQRREEHKRLLIPTILDYIEILERLCQADNTNNISAGNLDSSIRPFIALQALHVGHFLDLHDEFGKNKLLVLLRNLLCDFRVDSTLICDLVDLSSRVVGSDSGDRFLQNVMEIIADLCDQRNKQSQENVENEENEFLNEERAQAALRFEELERKLEDVEIESIEFSHIQNEMLGLETLLQDPCILIWLRTLEIIVQMLRIPGLDYLKSMLTEVRSIIVPAIESDVLAIREQGMLCFGLLALLDRHSASQYLGIFWHAIRSEVEDRDIKIICIKSVFDIMLCYPGLKPQYDADLKVNKLDSDSTTTNLDELDINSNTSNFLLELAQYIYHEDPEVQELVVEGFAKLAVFGRVRMVGILAALLDVYFSNTTASSDGTVTESRVPQILAVFFEQLGSRKHTQSTMRSSECLLSFLEEAVGYWIRRWINQNGLKVSNSSNTRQFSGVDPTTLMKFAMHHLDHTDKDKVGSDQKQCAHQNRIGINITIDIIALYSVMGLNSNPTQSSKQVNGSLKELYRCLAVSGGSCVEERSAVLFCGLLREVIKHSTNLVSSIPSFARVVDLERALSESLGCVEELLEADIHKTDLAWAHEQIIERTQQLNDQVQKSHSNHSNKAKKRTNRRATILSEPDSDVSMDGGTSESDCDNTEDTPLSQRRTGSMRKSKDDAKIKIQVNSAGSFQDSDGSLLEYLDSDQSSDDQSA